MTCTTWCRNKKSCAPTLHSNPPVMTSTEPTKKQTPNAPNTPLVGEQKKVAPPHPVARPEPSSASYHLSMLMREPLPVLVALVLFCVLFFYVLVTVVYAFATVPNIGSQSLFDLPTIDFKQAVDDQFRAHYVTKRFTMTDTTRMNCVSGCKNEPPWYFQGFKSASCQFRTTMHIEPDLTITGKWHCTFPQQIPTYNVSVVCDAPPHRKFEPRVWPNTCALYYNVDL